MKRSESATSCVSDEGLRAYLTICAAACAACLDMADDPEAIDVKSQRNRSRTRGGAP